ncbi:MAG: hypothetical protein FWC91_01925 [Defluviitaleaceae bacterium]|nr:hypothetical protein [Defluviitaleaceae bacterium]
MRQLQKMYRGIPYSPPTGLSVQLGSTVTTIHVEDASDAIFPPGENIAVLQHGGNRETIRYESKNIANNTLINVTRAFADGDVPLNWPQNTPIARNFTSHDLDVVQDNIEQLHADTESKIHDLDTDLQESSAALSDATNTALQVLSRIYRGVDLTIKFQEEISDAPFNGDPWAWIQNRIRSNNFTGILPGDFIPLEVAGNTYNMEVAGINTYERYGRAASILPPQIDFISRELWPDPIPWNLANYNNGLDSMTTPFLASNANAFINSLQTSVPNGTGASPPTTTVDYRSGGILSQIPIEVRNVITPKETLMGRRHSTGILLPDDNQWNWRVMDELWLPSEVEVYGCRQWGSNVVPEPGFGSGGYVQYPIFAQNMKRVKVIAGTDTRSYWWLVTPRGGSSTSVAVVSLNGVAAMSLSLTNTAGATATRVPICFRVA